MADIDAARVLIGGLPGTADDRRMYHATGGRLAGADSCVHTMPEYGTTGVYRHHVYSPAPVASQTGVVLSKSDTPCVCGHAEKTGDGTTIHTPCWLGR